MMSTIVVFSMLLFCGNAPLYANDVVKNASEARPNVILVMTDDQAGGAYFTEVEAL